ncbi:hypothetical protein JMG10_34280 [Nostoc ellipsosporum NOK]|nr:hypothetical protein [Nostoc ellipsosporum NOK]
MNRTALVCLVLLAGCSDKQLSSAIDQHRAFVCSHTITVTAAANAVIENASSIKDESVRAAAVAVAKSDLAIVESCATV